MKAKKFALIYFKTLYSRLKDQLKALNKVNSRLNKMNLHRNKENHSGKTNSANSFGAGFSHFLSNYFV